MSNLTMKSLDERLRVLEQVEAERAERRSRGGRRSGRPTIKDLILVAVSEAPESRTAQIVDRVQELRGGEVSKTSVQVQLSNLVTKDNLIVASKPDEGRGNLYSLAEGVEVPSLEGEDESNSTEPAKPAKPKAKDKKKSKSKPKAKKSKKDEPVPA